LLVVAIILLLGYITVQIAAGSAYQALLAPIGTFLAAALAFLLFGSGLVFSVPSETKISAPASEEVVLSERFEQVVTGKLPDRLDPPKKLPARVLVVVDNLDRLQGQEALVALGSIRALIDISEGSRCIFLVPVDRRALTRHLEGTLGAGSSSGAADDYLQKLFNLDIPLTQPELFDVRGFATSVASRLFLLLEAYSASSTALQTGGTCSASSRTCRSSSS
jgi:hypothetical protein